MQSLGLHIDGPFLRLVFLESKGKRTEIRSLRSTQLTSLEDVKQIYISGWRGEIGASICSLVRPLSLKITSRSQIEQGLPFQIESILHLPIEELAYTCQLEIHKEGTEAVLFIVPKKDLSKELEIWNKYSIEPDFITAQAQAIVSFAAFKCPDLNSAFLIHLGSQEWSCTWMEEGKVKKYFSLPLGIENLLAALWEDRKKVLFQKEVDGVARQIDLMQLKPHLNPHLSQKLEETRKSLAAVLFSFKETAGIKPILFAGRVQAFGRLCEYLSQATPDLPVYDPPIPISPDESLCALALGSALELQRPGRNSVQFLKNEFLTHKTWKRRGFWGFALLASSLILSIGIAWIGQIQISARKEIIAEALKKIVDPKLLRTAFQAGIDQGIEQAVSMIEKHNKEAPYLVQAPTVAEVLSWISRHPLLEIFASSGDPFEILNLRYQLASYPRIGNLKDPYSAKVELEFKVNSPMNARKFHEALLQEKSFIDLSEEIAWETLPSSYRATFTLMNRTPNVP